MALRLAVKYRLDKSRRLAAVRAQRERHAMSSPPSYSARRARSQPLASS
jgi:hypothetical protein